MSRTAEELSYVTRYSMVGAKRAYVVGFPLVDEQNAIIHFYLAAYMLL